MALLGPLPKPWHVELTVGHGNRLSVWFVDQGRRSDDDGKITTGSPVRTREDPRLMDVPLTGRRGGGEGEEADDPEVFNYFRNRNTGEVVNSDPCMMPEALEARGVSGLQRFALI
ncbi:hypothetical protein MAPG_04453 [Magnaporthiopsis poae ATCC 64411]|uniref:Uncharacterized protein n=1 Tax=Magnaporthiopsis poae (strain ATCC 64411 / 73-15) TaxID=644358 RepID=A0A0C4DWS3_MAGP6|nr:hypothetical protein MAPG_04453 [Magnaporthiopsis poae ATCC 64411]